jgi:hypothetical protein
VDAQVSKRTEAKAAVCFLAMSQGLGDYIRAIGTAAQNRVTDDMRTLANERIFPTITSEYHKVKPGMHPIFEYVKERDGKLTLILPALSLNDSPF